MFVLRLEYLTSLDQRAHLTDLHHAYLNEQFERGVFLAAGQSQPGPGAVIIALGLDKSSMERIAAGDPYAVEGHVRYHIDCFRVSRASDARLLDLPRR